jgi:hypothetical protein
MPRNPERRRTALRSFVVRLAVIMLLALIVPVAPSFAQASGQVRVRIVKAGLLASSGVLTWRGRNYPFRISAISLGLPQVQPSAGSRDGLRHPGHQRFTGGDACCF